MTGPAALETEAQARAYAAQYRQDRGLGEGNRVMLAAAVERRGIKPGVYERRVLNWLAGLEPQVCAVIARLIGGAYAAGLDDAQ